MTDAPPMPVALRVHLAHATVQAVGEASGSPLLHIKGPATDPSLSPGPGGPGVAATGPARVSTDADVLVHPDHARRFVGSLQQCGWRMVTTFRTGSAFEHAATLWHNELGFVDVHRHFPGIELDPVRAFELMWQAAHTTDIAHRACSVPSVGYQRLLLLLHAARNGGPSSDTTRRLWGDADDAVRAEVLRLAGELRAEVALAAATGQLDRFADRPSFDLWRAYSAGGEVDRMTEWRARFKAAPTLPARIGILGRAILVNRDHLAMKLQRQPTSAEVAREYLRRARRGVQELWRLVTSWGKGGR